MYFWFGLGIGVLIAVPLVAWASRRTEQRVRRLERRAQAAERLAELGTLTGGLAHEIKNPLSTVNLNVQLLKEDICDAAAELPTGSVGSERLDRAQRRIDSLTRETQRLRVILEDFLRFAGQVKLDLHPTNINVLVEELVDFFAPQAQAAKIQLRTQLSANPPVAPADAGLLKQAILNLIINATQAMDEARNKNVAHGGCNELIIRTDRKKSGGQDELQIHVTDCGPGIPAERLEKIFQPYYSSKKTGTGLGLPTTRRIIEEHGGTVSVHSEVGKGTDFFIALPAK